MRILARSVCLLLPLLAAPSLAREEKLCPRCDQTGWLPNPVLEGDAAEAEKEVRYCSVLFDSDRKGRGLPRIPCPKCLAREAHQRAEQEFAAEVAEAERWRAECRKIEETLRPRRPLIFIETDHFFLVFGLEKVKLGRRKVLGKHAAAHLYARRLEEFFDWFHEKLGVEEKDDRVLRHQIYLLPDLRTLVKASQVFAQAPTDRAGRAVGDPSIFVTWRDPGTFRSDASFHQHVVHHTTHQLLGVLFLKIWLVERAGWFEEGLAHEAEMELFGRAGNSCNTEDSEEDMPDEDWEPLVRKGVVRGLFPPFVEMARKRADQLTALEHQKAWSAVDFLFARDPSAVAPFVLDLKKDRPLRDALRARFGIPLVRFDEEWEAWVLENYRKLP